jgi:hypothetical protein
MRFPCIVRTADSARSQHKRTQNEESTGSWRAWCYRERLAYQLLRRRIDEHILEQFWHAILTGQLLMGIPGPARRLWSCIVRIRPRQHERDVEHGKTLIPSRGRVCERTSKTQWNDDEHRRCQWRVTGGIMTDHFHHLACSAAQLEVSCEEAAQTMLPGYFALLKRAIALWSVRRRRGIGLLARSMMNAAAGSFHKSASLHHI